MNRSSFRYISRYWSWKNLFLLLATIIVLTVGVFFAWAATLKLPDVQSFSAQENDSSTKIYDRTGKILLYDMNPEKKHITVASDQISPYIKDATVAIEDQNFYQHGGISITSIIRAALVDITSLGYSQGGSTITQQVVKNALLSDDKSISRKLKEWVLAIELERVMSKDDILNTYLNESPYGGNIYGVEEASEAFFGKKASDVTLAEAATLAALPQAPTHYSPYGNNVSELMARKDLVLQKMLQNKFITQDQFTQAEAEQVTFAPQEESSIKAPHFAMYVAEYLEQKYGADVGSKGYTVITTLDYDLEEKAESIVKTYALQNQKTYNASNAALVATDPKTGQILVMVGSRDYFDTTIDGNFNVATAYRQPGSAFKPFVYATAFEKGYLPSTVVFDLPTEFSTDCNPDGTPKSSSSSCYMPVNYDGQFLGPINLRDAIAQSRNIPSIKVLYLAGIADSLQTAKNMGITSLLSADHYGLTLVLGGGEVSPLEMAGAYGVFANEGVRNPLASILSVTDPNGNTLEQFQSSPTRVLDQNIALMISDVLSDNTARAPAYGLNSPLYIPGYDVAAKTGTTNDFKDAWIVGYSPTLSVAAWAGNNDNTPIDKKVAGLVVAPLWGAFMTQALTEFPKEDFDKPLYPDTSSYPPIISGHVDLTNPHEILYYIDKNNPLVPRTTDPTTDPQYQLWEYPVRIWAYEHGLIPSTSTPDIFIPATSTVPVATTSVIFSTTSGMTN